jgi:mannose-6-phosphate isomerase-like protein (cupin superfamily)
MYLGEPPERVQVQRGGLIHVDATTPLQVVNNGTEDLVLYVYGCPPEYEHAEILESAI